MTRVLVVDDDAVLRYTLRGILEHAGAEVDEAADGEAALLRLEAGEHHLVITDLRMPRMDGLELLRRVRERPGAPRVILITAHGSEAAAVEAMRLGAYDYFRKPFEVDELVAVVRRATEAVRLQAEVERLSGELNLSRSLIFAAPAMSRLALLVARVAPRDVNVLITGETGTGKERVAEAIVRASARAERPFLRFNCAAIAPELAEAELFGHARGAFTGAHRARPGLFREADGGTVLLDEVGELSPTLQAKLLRVLEGGEVRPVGEARPVRVDVRILAATHRDLQALSDEGRFRADLYFRLKVVHLRVPPLRERPEDIPALTRHFLDAFARRFGAGPFRLEDDLLARLQAWSWPGNVRELENLIESMVALSTGTDLDPSLVPAAAAPAVPGDAGPDEDGAPPAADLRSRVDAYERGLLVAALSAARGNRSQAARALGINRATLHTKLRKYGLARDEDPQG